MFVASSVLITQSPHFELRATNNDAKPPLLAADLRSLYCSGNTEFYKGS